MHVEDIPTPALVVDLAALDANIARMGAEWPGPRLRPHVKAFKSTALAGRLAAAEHRSFCCATLREVAGRPAAGRGEALVVAHAAGRVVVTGGGIVGAAVGGERR